MKKETVDKEIVNNEPFHRDCYLNGKCKEYETCPMSIAEKLLSGKWKILILWYLSSNTLRFSDIKKRLPQVTQRMLSIQLKSLEEDNIITRKVYPEVPPKVEYSLTETGERLVPILELMHSFGADYLNQN